MELGIVEVSGGVALGFLVHAGAEGVGEIDAGLIGEADQDKENIGHFITEALVEVAGLGALVAVGAGEEAGEFADLFNELGQVGQLGEIADADRGNPGVDGLLGFVEREGGMAGRGRLDHNGVHMRGGV